MKLTADQLNLLQSLGSGKRLKNHRTIDGAKVNKLHEVNGEVIDEVAAKDVQRLLDAGLITSNMKFPTAAYTITERGMQEVQAQESSYHGESSHESQ